jgi:hypothetical protein
MSPWSETKTTMVASCRVAVQHARISADLVVEIGDVGEIGAARAGDVSSVMSKLRQSLASKSRCECGS